MIEYQYILDVTVKQIASNVAVAKRVDKMHSNVWEL
jgi:hypothetical protein